MHAWIFFTVYCFLIIQRKEKSIFWKGVCPSRNTFGCVIMKKIDKKSVGTTEL